MKRDCPHCFSRVLPGTDGCCPSCRGDMSAAKALPLTTVRIRIGDELPPLCVACGQNTAATATITRSMSEGGQPWPVKVLAFLMSPFLALALDREFQAKQREASIAVPFCEACSAGGKEPRPTFVNFEREEFTFIVHDKFGDALRET